MTDNIDIGYEIKYVYLDGKMTMYRLFYWKKHYICVDVNRNAEIRVYARQKDSIEQIESAILDRKYTILWWQEHQEKLLMNLNQNFITILNKKYYLKPISRKLKNKFEILGNTIYINANTEEQKKEIVPAIFDVTACEYMRKSTLKWAKKMGYTVNKIVFGWSKRIWGCCWPTLKKIKYSYNLCFFEKDVIDSVIIHELCHYAFLRHNKDFWLEVAKWCPKYKDYDKILNLSFMEDISQN